MAEIVWKFPGPDEPGYLRRRRELCVLLEVPATSAAVDAEIEYALPYVVEPEDRKAARQALLEMPTLEFHAAVLQLLGYQVEGGNATCPPKP